jgi:Protein of unknown function (DUF3365)
MVRRVAVAMLFAMLLSVHAWADSTASEDEISLALANMLRAGRTVISTDQKVINDPGTDKGITGARVRDDAIRIYREKTGSDPDDIIAKNRYGKLLAVQIESIAEVVDDNQSTINKAGIGFKGFVPAIFARLVNERFREKVGNDAEIKVTAPVDLVRNRKALPDDWEVKVIDSKLSRADWPKNKVYAQLAEKNGRPAYRVLVPEYYSENCLSCHGEPRGEIDITGYPKEGGHKGQLGGIISISLYR